MDCLPVVGTILDQLCERLFDEKRESAICASDHVRSFLLDSIYDLIPKKINRLIVKTHHRSKSARD